MTTRLAPVSAAGRATSPLSAPERLLSLDVFRGITIAAMLLVNNPGSWSHVYPPLLHAQWHGWTPTDLIFPFFLFIVGVSMSLSFAKMEDAGTTRGVLVRRVIRRSLILVALGLVLQSFPWWRLDLATLRLPGVLQRIGLAYLLASAVVLAFGTRVRLAALLLALVGYWAAMRWVPVPGIGAGVWEPGMDLGAYIDRAVLGERHLWAQARTWDPEGLFSTIPAVASVLIGWFAGEWLRSGRPSRQRITGMLAAGAAGVALGLAWSSIFPINKPLWTSSYVLFTGGLALVGLALCHWSVDLRRSRWWTAPFVVLGVNAITAFFLSSLVARVLLLLPAPGGGAMKGWLFERIFLPVLPPTDASLAFAVLYLTLWIGAMAVLHRRGIFIRI